MTEATHLSAWPFKEAERLLARYASQPPAKGYVLFETGYGPSGLPHIGTFGEVLRTTMVRRAFAEVSDIPTKLFAFSDDMDGLRKVPTNVPNQELLAKHLHKPLTQVPDPFGEYPSFGEHNNARLRAFLDAYGFAYEFKSATECYKSGMFDATLLKILQHYDTIMNIMLPSLGAERQATYSPFLPICPESGQVLQVPVLEHDAAKGTILYQRADGKTVETPVTGGACKLQWKVDWAMRWVALGVDYEMSGKDLIDSVKLSSKITQALGAKPPENLTYELFLDEQGQKISKSKGNGLSMEEWLSYAPRESLSYYMFQAPQRAKRLYFDVIPKAMDEYLQLLKKYPEQSAVEQKNNPIWHIHGGAPPRADTDISFALLLNLAGACNAEEPSVLWGFIQKYDTSMTPTSSPMLATMVALSLIHI
jgi:lysyl-tRNA synthetase class 1